MTRTPLPEAPSVKLCRICLKRWPAAEVLTARHPFIPSRKVDACPNCCEMGVLENACVVEGCTNPICVGAPNRHGFRYALMCPAHNQVHEDNRPRESRT